MDTFTAFGQVLIDFLSLDIFVWFAAAAILFFGFSFFWTLFHKR